eukprot:PhM_4_TR12635/c0_g1_i1/m.2335
MTSPRSTPPYQDALVSDVLLPRRSLAWVDEQQHRVEANAIQRERDLRDARDDANHAERVAREDTQRRQLALEAELEKERRVAAAHQAKIDVHLSRHRFTSLGDVEERLRASIVAQEVSERLEVRVHLGPTALLSGTFGDNEAILRRMQSENFVNKIREEQKNVAERYRKMKEAQVVEQQQE